MGNPFEPNFRDGRSAADLIAELVKHKPYGYVLTYHEIADTLGVDVSEMPRIRSAVQRAKVRLERDHQRAIEARTSIGYEILQPGAHVGLAVKHRRKSDRQIKRAISVIGAADERDMTDAERERSRHYAMGLQLLHDRQVETEARVERLEKLMLGGTRKVIPGTLEPPIAEIDAAYDAIGTTFDNHLTDAPDTDER